MSEFHSASNTGPAANSTPVKDPLKTSQTVATTENQQQLYIDFASDTPPVLPTGSQLAEGGNKSEIQVVKKPDPRQQWINKDPTKPYYCKLCDFNMDSMEIFQHHCMSPRHVKRSIEEFNIKIPKRLDDKEEKKSPPEYNCQVCLVTCNSDTAWNSHLLGQKHRKALEKQGAERAQQKAQEKGLLMNNMNTGHGRGAGRGAGGRGGGGGPIRGGAYNPGHLRKPYDKPMHAVQQPSLSGPIGARDFATYPEPLIGLEYVTEIQVIGQSPRYHCELCDSKFDHNLKFPHLVGSKHRFNVLKEKVPDVAQNIRGDVKKRSELSSKLLEEANRLEIMEGRQQVKTRMEKSPFNSVNNQARGGFSGNSHSMVQQSSQGDLFKNMAYPFERGAKSTKMRGGGQSYVHGGGQGGARGGWRGGGRGRGNQQAASYNYQQQQQQQQQQPMSNRGGIRGRGRGSGGNNQNRSWKQDFPYNSVENQTYVDSSYSADDGYQWNNSSHGGGMLPAEAFKPRSPPRAQNQGQQQFGSYQDEYYDDFYPEENQNTSYSSSNYEYNDSYSDQNTYSSQNTNQQRFQTQTPTATAGNSSATTSGDSAENKSVSLLQGAIADLGKLVSSEEDASMALQVSNALTQALLQFRMNNLKQEGTADNSTAANTTTSMSIGT